MRYRIRLLSLPILFLMASPIFAVDTISNYLFRNITVNQLQALNVELSIAFDSERLEDAIALGTTLVEIAEKDETVDKISYARVLSNSAILQALGGNRGVSIFQSTQAIELIEMSDPFHPDLFNILMVKSYTQNAEDLHTEAEDSLRRAQHIVHRQDGVYTPRQIPIIESITGIKIARGEYQAADQEQRFNLKVSEQAYGIASEELMPTLNKLGKYFADRGSSIPLGTTQEQRLYRDRLFRESSSILERSISIIEDKYGDTDLRLIDPLKGLARTKFKQGYGRVNAERPMERALEIVRGNPATDKADHAKALVALADLYTITADTRAGDMYLEAWQLLADDPVQEQLRYELFARPKRLLPEVPIQPVLYRHPVEVEKGNELFVEIQYDIREDGKVRNAVVIEGNVPNSDRKLMRDFVSTMRFRPRIVDGQLARTEGMSLHQNYQIKEHAPDAKFTISSGVN